jgi:hypothetical protein
MRFLAVLCLLLGVQVASSVNCSATHFDYTNRYTLGKQDELNRTFAKIQEKITSLEDVTYKPSDSISFTVSSVNPSFYYRDSKQKAVIRGNDTIVIEGGFLEVDFTFNWSKTNLVTRTGTGSAQGLSFEIIIAKKMVIDTGFYSYELLDSMPVTFSSDGSAFKLTRIDPPDASAEDIAAIVKMLNSVEGGKDVRTELQNEIDKYYDFYLRASLHDEHQPIGLQFDYKWVPNVPGKQNVTISMLRRPISVDIEKEGIQTTFEVQVENDSSWKCGNRSVPLSPFDPRIYGGTQQFVSYDFYEGLIRYAIGKDILNSELTRSNWESRMFQFYAGDLYEILPLLQSRYFASVEVAGTCSPNYNNLKVQKGGKDTFEVYINFDCSLTIEKNKLIDFAVNLKLTIAGEPSADSIDYKLRSHEQNVTFFSYADYKMANVDLATEMVKHSLNRLYEGRLFGSGWPLSPPKDYPGFLAESNFTMVYDSSHVFTSS